MRVGKDTEGPVFSMETDSVEVSVKDDESALLKGITAFDSKEGDVTASIIVESISPFMEERCRYVKYAVADSNNNVTHSRRKIIYKDYVSPRFVLQKPLRYPVNAVDILSEIHAQDCLDGDISDLVSIESKGEISTGHAGVYNVELKVMNSAGDISQLPVSLEIYDEMAMSGRPQIELNKYLLYIDQGADFDASEFIVSVTANGNRYNPAKDKMPGKIRTESTVDTDLPGNYKVTYEYEDTESRTGTGSATLYVVVTKGENTQDGK